MLSDVRSGDLLVRKRRVKYLSLLPETRQIYSAQLLNGETRVEGAKQGRSTWGWIHLQQASHSSVANVLVGRRLLGKHDSLDARLLDLLRLTGLHQAGG